MKIFSFFNLINSSLKHLMPQSAWIEGAVVFFLLFPTYALLLPNPGWARILGLLFLACVCCYILLFSPHRIPTPQARDSLREVIFMLTWSLSIVWGVFPQGLWGYILGHIFLGGTIFYILFLAREFQGDSLEEWGLGSPRKFVDYLIFGKHCGWAWVGLYGINLALAAGVHFFPDFLAELQYGIFRRVSGLGLLQEIPLRILPFLPFLVVNFLVIFLVRYDNLLKAGTMTGVYLLIQTALVALIGYVYFYRIHCGWVEFLPREGILGVGAYFFWGTLQEILFLSYFNTRIRKGIDNPLASAQLTAVIFSIYHVPAYPLMGICFGVGILWALIFQAEQNLIIMGLNHAISAAFGLSFKVHGMVMVTIKATVGPFHME